MSPVLGSRGWHRARDLDSDPRGPLGSGGQQTGRRGPQAFRTFSSPPGEGGIDVFCWGGSF